MERSHAEDCRLIAWLLNAAKVGYYPHGQGTTVLMWEDGSRLALDHEHPFFVELRRVALRMKELCKPTPED